MKKISALVIVSCIALFFSSCSVGFISQSAYNYLGVLWRSEDIKSLLADPATDPAVKEKLSLVLEARDFATSIGLSVKRNYSTFSTVSSDSLAWVLTASRRTAFEPYTWWYPIVGSVPYKGFFKKADADELGEDLKKDGYETAVRDTVAFSTLGWFSDPVLSSITQLASEQMIETILHELLHATVWVSGQVEFNETLANFVGLTAAEQFFENRAPGNQEFIDHSVRNKLGAALYSEYLNELMSALTTLYDRKLSEAETLQQRQEILVRVNASFAGRLTNAQMYQSVNNAALQGTSLYYKKFDSFQRLFDKTGKNWSRFLSCIKIIADKHSDDPFPALNEGCAEK